jgi:hypothetical protein
MSAQPQEVQGQPGVRAQTALALVQKGSSSGDDSLVPLRTVIGFISVRLWRSVQ